MSGCATNRIRTSAVRKHAAPRATVRLAGSANLEPERGNNAPPPIGDRERNISMSRGGGQKRSPTNIANPACSAEVIVCGIDPVTQIAR